MTVTASVVLFETECTLTLHDHCFYARDVVKRYLREFLPQLENRLVLWTPGEVNDRKAFPSRILKNKIRRLRRRKLTMYGAVVLNIIPINEGQAFDCGIYVPFLPRKQVGQTPLLMGQVLKVFTETEKTAPKIVCTSSLS